MTSLEPSKHARSDSHPVWIGSEVLARGKPNASRPDPFGLILTRSARTKSEAGWFCTIWFGSLWQNAAMSESGKLVGSHWCVTMSCWVAEWFCRMKCCTDPEGSCRMNFWFMEGSCTVDCSVVTVTEGSCKISLLILVTQGFYGMSLSLTQGACGMSLSLPLRDLMERAYHHHIGILWKELVTIT